MTNLSEVTGVVVADCHLDATTIGEFDNDSGVHSNWIESYGRLLDAAQHAININASLFIVAGDLFHTGRPLPEAVARAKEIVRMLTGSGVRVIIDEGNHDQSGIVGGHRTPISAYFMNEPEVDIVDEPMVLRTDSGLAVAVQPWQRVAGKAHIDDASAELRDSVRWLADEVADEPSIFVGHLVTDNVTYSSGRRGSETTMTTSTLEAVLQADDLDDAPFGASFLGHIHLGQQVGQRSWYVGSTYRHTFGERNDPKRFAVFHTNSRGKTRVEFEEMVNAKQLIQVELTDEMDIDDLSREIGDVRKRDVVRVFIPQDRQRELRKLKEELVAAGVTVELRNGGRVAPIRAASSTHTGPGIDATPQKAFDAFIKARGTGDLNSKKVRDRFIQLAHEAEIIL